ncbi:unnamed protein product [Arabidopsis thaliana]|uniref:(thale cress) hypothetical protein n=1 Tax=Arabidopsis thaliana TaxID=3702 RepID=A0A7G2FJ19_ARATH|nr:unnamed protein product [Arabidopsis thaliana]
MKFQQIAPWSNGSFNLVKALLFYKPRPFWLCSVFFFVISFILSPLMGNSILLLSFILGLPFIVDSVNFKFTSFRPGGPENVVYHGDAIPDGAPTDFSTSFSFRIDTRNLSNYGHGICFFLAPVGIQLPVNSAGDFLGLFSRIESYASSSPLVHIEFDSFNNQEWDPTILPLLDLMWESIITHLFRLTTPLGMQAPTAKILVMQRSPITLLLRT